jgi:hypothetical protein
VHQINLQRSLIDRTINRFASVSQLFGFAVGQAMHGNLATMETDLSLGPAPVVADAASAASSFMMRAETGVGTFCNRPLGGTGFLAIWQ